MLIAIASVTNVIRKAKEDSYNSQVKLILDSARQYVFMNNIIIPSNNSRIITLKELQDSGLVNKDIKDPRTNNIIPDSTWIVVRNNNDNLAYNIGYTANGLILHYDAIFNGGINIHNDNGSANKAIWKDLSGNNNDGTLSNYSFDSNSGWTSNSLRSLAGYTGSVLQNTTFTNLQSFTVEVFGIFNENLQTAYPRIISTNGNYTGIYQGINGVDLTCASTSPTNSLNGYVSNGIQENYTAINGIGSMGLMSIAYNWDYSTKKLSVYRDGVKLKEYSITLYGNINFNKLGLDHGKNANTGSHTYYTVRVYNRPLTAVEINSNYQLDKIRYGY